jgi:hypothetical protein
MDVTGKCLCGHISYKAEIDPNLVYVCHCSDCQQHSGSAFGVGAGVVDDQFHLLAGTLKSFIKVAASGINRELAFCPECGTRIYAKDPGDDPGFISLRYGTIEQRNELAPIVQIWCGSAQPWAIIGSLPEVEHQS